MNMDERAIYGIINDLASHSLKSMPFNLRLREFDEAIEWAEKSNRIDLVLQLTSTLSKQFAYSRLKLPEDENAQQKLLLAKMYWQKGLEYSLKGLEVATQTYNTNIQVKLLNNILRLSILFVGNYDLAMNSTKQLLELTTSELSTSEEKWGLAYEIGKYGRQIATNNASASRFMLNTSLNLFEELGDKSAIADALLSCGELELELGNTMIAKDCFERAIITSRQSGHVQANIRSLIGLGKSHQKEGQAQEAKAEFEEALFLTNSLELPIREELRVILHTLISNCSL